MDVPSIKPVKTWHTDPYPFISPTRPELSARGKNVVVTGGGTGIGKATAVAFAQAGASSVAIIGRRSGPLDDAKTEVAKAGGGKTTVLTESVDLSDLAATKTAFESIAKQMAGNKIDILVSNAAVSFAPGAEPSPVLDSDTEHLMTIFKLNVVTGINALKAFTPHASAENPTVINITTGLVHIPALPIPLSFYTSSKAAALKMFEYYATENPHVHTASLHPGVVKTDMNDGSIPATDAPELAAHFGVWLASPEAKFLKGKVVWVNWDAKELMDDAEEIQGSTKLTWKLEGLPI